MMISIDWITKLPISEGWDSILTITNHDCSKAVIFIPCKETMGTEERAKQYFKWVFPHYGIPNKIISDRDPWVMSDLAKAICKEGNIQQNISTAYHPQTDGQSERTNQTLETYLRIFCGHQQDDLAIWLPIAQYALNARPSHTTKVSPFETVIGVIPRGINNLAIKESNWDGLTNLKNIRDKAHEAILHSQMLLTRDGNFKPYKEGELVWLNARNLQKSPPSQKLRVKRYCPIEITKALSHVTYQLKLPPSWKIHNTFHATYLSPFKETQEHGPNFLEPPPEIIEGQEEWEVEGIVNRRFFGKKKTKQYLVKWKGYSDAHNTWEPEENIFANELIQQYKGKHKQSAPTCIRATGIQPEESRMPAEFPPSQLQVPSTNITEPPSPTRQDSPKSVPGYIEPILAELADKTVKEATAQLKAQVERALLQYQTEIPMFAQVSHQKA